MIDLLCRDIIRDLRITRVVETGTYDGETVAELCRWDLGVDIHSVDIDRRAYRAARKQFDGRARVHLACGASDAYLAELLATRSGAADAGRWLFFLDAHWRTYWPLREEIRIIQALETYAIVIDDFFVPGKSDPAAPFGLFGFELYRRRVLDWSYVADLFPAEAVRIFYPGQPNRDGRGWVLIVKGADADALTRLASRDLFEVARCDPAHLKPVPVTWRARWDPRRLVKRLASPFLVGQINRVYTRHRWSRTRRRRVSPPVP